MQNISASVLITFYYEQKQIEAMTESLLGLLYRMIDTNVEIVNSRWYICHVVPVTIETDFNTDNLFYL